MHAASRPTVLVIDDHVLVATALEMALTCDAWEAARAQGRSVSAILAEAGECPPGVALVDLDLGHDPQGNWVDGLGLVAPLTASGWRVIVVSGTTDRARLGGALAAGALAWLPKRAPLEHLRGAVRAAFSGTAVMDPEARRTYVELFEEQDRQVRQIAERMERLSAREREVLHDLAQGMRARAIAERYVVSVSTVRTQIRGILTKLEVGSQLEAVVLVRQQRKPWD